MANKRNNNNNNNNNNADIRNMLEQDDSWIDLDQFRINSQRRHDEENIWEWGTFDQTRVYKVLDVKKVTSKYEGRLCGVITCVNRDGGRRMVFGPHSLLEEIERYASTSDGEAQKHCYFQCLGTETFKNGKSKHMYRFDVHTVPEFAETALPMGKWALPVPDGFKFEE